MKNSRAEDYKVNAMSAIALENPAVTSPPDNHWILTSYIQQNTGKLYRTICMYVRKSGICAGEEAKELASEILNEVVAKALKHADRFDPNKQVMAWLMGIASNLLLQERQKRAKNARREPFYRDLAEKSPHLPIDEFLGQFIQSTQQTAEDSVSSKQAYQKLLSHVSDPEQKLLELAIIQQCSAKEIALQLQCKPGAVRVRLYRALKRLRQALEQRDT